MVYAHKGSSSDNALIILDGFPVRTFLAFESKASRQKAQDQIYDESDGEENLIFCTRKEVEKWFGKDFVVNSMGEVRTMRDYERETW